MRVRRMAALAAVTTGLLAGFAAPAAADTPLTRGGLSLCNERAQPITGEFPQRGGFSTILIQPGTCHSRSLIDGRANEQVVVYAHYNGGHKLAVDHFFFDSRTWYPRTIR